VWIAAADAVFDAARALAGAADDPRPHVAFLTRRVQEAAREFDRAGRNIGAADAPDAGLREAAEALASWARDLADAQSGPEPAGEYHASLLGTMGAMQHYATERGLPDPLG
jgi:hypothetical protein